jgi:hypothetical protein
VIWLVLLADIRVKPGLTQVAVTAESTLGCLETIPISESGPAIPSYQSEMLDSVPWLIQNSGQTEVD